MEMAQKLIEIAFAVFSTMSGWPSCKSSSDTDQAVGRFTHGMNFSFRKT